MCHSGAAECSVMRPSTLAAAQVGNLCAAGEHMLDKAMCCYLLQTHQQREPASHQAGQNRRSVCQWCPLQRTFSRCDASVVYAMRM